MTLTTEANQNPQPNQNEQKLKFNLQEIGRIPGPTMNGIETFQAVYGLFTQETDLEAVHQYETGEQIPIRLVSYPIPIESPTAIRLRNNTGKILL